jgi:hypothetical protein
MKHRVTAPKQAVRSAMNETARIEQGVGNVTDLRQLHDQCIARLDSIADLGEVLDLVAAVGQNRVSLAALLKDDRYTKFFDDTAYDIKSKVTNLVAEPIVTVAMIDPERRTVPTFVPAAADWSIHGWLQGRDGRYRAFDALYDMLIYELCLNAANHSRPFEEDAALRFELDAADGHVVISNRCDPALVGQFAVHQERDGWGDWLDFRPSGGLSATIRYLRELELGDARVRVAPRDLGEAHFAIRLHLEGLSQVSRVA